VERGVKGAGAPTDEEQDVIRAMLVLAAAGLDAICKQVVKDALPFLATVDAGSNEQLVKFAERQLAAAEEHRRGTVPTGNKFLASLFSIATPRRKLIEHFVADLTGSSLQSASELGRVASAVGLALTDIGIVNELNEAFRVRNQIVHEFDIDFGHPTRNRKQRNLKNLVKLVNVLLDASECLVRETDRKVRLRMDERAALLGPS
jgi:hypothetical protein